MNRHSMELNLTILMTLLSCVRSRGKGFKEATAKLLIWNTLSLFKPFET